jgi:hypothetical protein
MIQTNFGCSTGIFPPPLVKPLSSYRGYCGANGIPHSNAKNERKRHLDLVHFAPPGKRRKDNPNGRPIKFYSLWTRHLTNGQDQPTFATQGAWLLPYNPWPQAAPIMAQ